MKIEKGDFKAGLRYYLKRSPIKFGGDLAKALGLSSKTVSFYMSGETTPTVSVLCWICDLLKTHPNALLGYETLPPKTETLLGIINDLEAKLWASEATVLDLRRKLYKALHQDATLKEP